MKFFEFIKPDFKKIAIFSILVLFILILVKTSSYSIYSLSSDAMLPSYSKGDLLIAKIINYDELNIGDVIIHSVENKQQPYWIMRVISKDEEQRIFTTKGDNNKMVFDIPPLSQKNLPEENLKAKVTFRIPYLGYLELFRIGWLIKITIFYLMACLISSLSLKSKVKYGNFNKKRWIIFITAVIGVSLLLKLLSILISISLSSIYFGLIGMVVALVIMISFIYLDRRKGLNVK